ncbi:MAG TPA: hypothetical protein VFJ13_08690 [Paracoccaceae bacterium]|nr:hypothetical protein [Paracoccaceae bacterium]
MRRIAYLLSADVCPGRENRREDYWEVEGELNALAEAGADCGFELVPAVWDEARDWSRFEAAIVRGTWDLMQKTDRFLPGMEAIAAQTRLLNPLPTLQRNYYKSYLPDLDAAGAPVPETIIAERATPEAAEQAFARFGGERLVVKPLIGASSWRQALIRRGEPFPEADSLPPGRCLIQPYLESVAREGETTLLYFNGAFSHALVKRPAAGDYRTQALYGAREEGVTPDAAQIEAAEKALAAWGEDLLYARVDLVKGAAGEWLVMELELIEPYLYLPFAQDGEAAAARRFTAALETRLASEALGSAAE